MPMAAATFRNTTIAARVNRASLDVHREYAPKAFAEMPQAQDMTWRAFQSAQERLFAAGTIENVSYGPPSKGTKRIARTIPGATQ
jgi:hypothetical protein